MSEILFRGKRIADGEWVEGWLTYRYRYDQQSQKEILGPVIDYPHKLTIGKTAGTTICSAKVDPSTVGQFTGLTDRNGKRIFEGDIIKWNDKMGHIVFGMGCFCVKYLMPHCQYRNSPAIDIVFHEYPNEVEVVCNIHDNSELLEGGIDNA